MCIIRLKSTSSFYSSLMQAPAIDFKICLNLKITEPELTKVQILRTG
jgi:hypothetical protein